MAMSANGEVKMRDSQSFNNASAPIDSSSCAAISLPPTDDDAGLLTLEMQFNSLVAELIAAQTAIGEFVISPDQRSLVHHQLRLGVEAKSDHEASTKRMEAILKRLYPIEQAIMGTSASTTVGLGVKARHAAYVMYEYWNGPIDRIDWEARAVRLLIEAVCKVAQAPLPFRGTSAGEIEP